MKRLIIAIVILILLIVAGYFIYTKYLQKTFGIGGAVTRTASSYKATEGSKSVEFQDITNPSTVNLGLPVYSGAVISTVQGDSTSSVVNGLKMTVLTYTSSDPVDKVVSFYKDQMGPSAVTYDNKLMDRTETTVAKSQGDTKSPFAVVTTDSRQTILRLVKVGS